MPNTQPSRQNSPPGSMSRRGFLKAAAQASAVLLAPAVLTSSVLGRDGMVAPSERIIMGGVGLHNRGMSDLKNWILPEKEVQFVAICDAVKAHGERVKQTVDAHYGSSDCKTYTDLRQYLAERTDIDGILMATGDHNHALVASLVMRSGKDVYSEKPSSMTIAQGRMVVEASRRYGRVYQTGTQRLSEMNFVYCIEMARQGRLGKVHTSYAHIAPWDAAEMKFDWKDEEPLPPKDAVDWDEWLGGCPYRPYNGSYIQGGWRGYYDFHTSCIGEWGAHTFAQAQAGIDCLNTAASEYQYVDNPTGDGMVTTFPNGVKMVLSRGNKYWHGSCGMRFDGPKGWVAAADGYSRPDVSDPSLLADYKKIVADYIARTQRPMNHMRDFLDCVRTRRLTVANAEVMHYSMSTVHAANICMWLKRNLKYDPVKEEFIGDEEANRYRTRAMRAPWIL